MTENYPTVPPIDSASGTMPDDTMPGQQDRSGTSTTSGPAETAKHVGETAKGEARGVASEVKTQARDLMDQARSEVKEQASSQQQRAASGLRSVSDQLRSMADGAQEQGVATSLVSQTASRAGDFASWLEEREPGAILDEVRSFARRRPGVFIAITAVAGVVVGRLTRSMIEEASSDSSTPSAGTMSAGTTSTGTMSTGTPYTGTTPAGPMSTGTPSTGTGTRSSQPGGVTP